MINDFVYHYDCIKDTLKAFGNFKNKQNSVSSSAFWYVKVLYKSVFNALLYI